ncbi:MAG TPA: LanC-like protein [Casimicrobiaceae bacterium]|nr:LanC-like protein [Casimicrobiaceae bacterium]
MLFEPDRHEALEDVAWDESRAREAIRSIVGDIEENGRGGCLWPMHPLDDEGDSPRGGCSSLYLGSAGVLWALWQLQREGAVELRGDPVEGIRNADTVYPRQPDTGEVVPSYFLGESGILLALWRLTGARAAADRLYASVRSNVQNPTNEALWGAPGTMLAAWHLWKQTGESRWHDLFVENADAVWSTWHFDERAGCHVWTQALYGRLVQYLGAGHGFAGNVYPLLKGAALLDAPRREALYDRCLATLRATAQREGDAINWRPGFFDPRPGGARMLMQWCHGAPGMVTAIADFPPQRSAELDAMLVAAGNAIWRAGPLVKGYGLCHGTAGNGYAFLKLFRRTGDRVWLDRARSFAMHALGQLDRMRARFGQGRYTLWTGDPGLAVYAWRCIRGGAELPALDALS